jgi:hypothetical protein
MLSQKKMKKEKPIVKWRDMQKTIHGADDIVISSKSSLTEKPPVLEHDPEDPPESVREHESDSETTLNESGDGLTWLDGPPPNLANVERYVFNVEDTVNVGSSYLLDLLDSTPTMVRSQPSNRPKAPLPPSSAPTAPKETDWSVW